MQEMHIALRAEQTGYQDLDFGAEDKIHKVEDYRSRYQPRQCGFGCRSFRQQPRKNHGKHRPEECGIYLL